MPDSKHNSSKNKPGLRTKMIARWARFQEKFSSTAGSVGSAISKGYMKAGTFLGLMEEPTEEAEETDVRAYLREADKQVQTLPEHYRHLFDTASEPKPGGLVGREEELENIKEAFRQWQESGAGAVAVTGERGSGKSTMLDQAASIFSGDVNVHRLQVDQTIRTRDDLIKLFNTFLPGKDDTSVEELIHHLNDRMEASVVILDDFQQMYLRHLDGYEAIESFIYVLAETGSHIFWMVGCPRYAWEYLQATHQLGDYFSQHLQTDTLDEEKVEQAIINRHKTNGSELVFASSQSDTASQSYRKFMDDEQKAQAYLRQRYFKKLTRQSGNNLSVAFRLWLRSIKEFDDDRCQIAPLEEGDLSFENYLQPDLSFALAALALHGNLSPDELALTQNQSSYESVMLLKRLQQQGAVVSNKNRYCLNFGLYRPVIDALKNKNILHF